MEVISAPEAVCDEASCSRVAGFFAGQDIDVLHPLVITWSFDHYTVRIQQACPLPVAVRSIPGIRTGSIVGCQQLGCVLTDIEVEHRLFFGQIDSMETAAEIAIYARACTLKKRMRGTRFLLLGRRTPGMTPIAIDEVEILRLFGAFLLPMGMDELATLTDQVSARDAETEWKLIGARAATVTCSAAHGVASTRTYLALKQLVRELGLQGISVGSYPACQGTICLPAALLNEEGTVVGCGEGDLNSTLLMYLLNQITGKPVHFGEMLELDEAANAIVSSHCGAGPPSMADEDGYVFCPVRMAHSGVCIRYKARPGAVTYVNLVGRRTNYRLCAFEGEAVTTGMVFEGNPMRLAMKTPLRSIWKTVSDHGFGHHWMAVYEHVVPVLAEFCRLTGVQGIFPGSEGE
jgi:L-fucose isomerase-like protein